MNLRDIMKYIESEYKVINNTFCEICGSEYITEDFDIILINNEPYDICECVCRNCGHEKIFEFHAPFVEKKDYSKLKKKMN